MNKLWWIKERYNPQLGTYYVPEGQMSKTAAKKKEHALYGDNIMHSFESEEEYKKEIERLKSEGCNVH